MQARPTAPIARRAASACKAASRNSPVPQGPSRPRPASLLAKTAPPACTVAWALSVGVAAVRAFSARHGRRCSSRALLDDSEARRDWWTMGVQARAPRASTASRAVLAPRLHLAYREATATRRDSHRRRTAMLALLVHRACLAPRRPRRVPLALLRRTRAQESARNASPGAFKVRRARPCATPAQLVAIARSALLWSSRAQPDPLETPRASPHKLAAPPALRVTLARWAQERPHRALLAPSPQMRAQASAQRVKREDTKAPSEQPRATRALVEHSALRAQCRRLSAPQAPIRTSQATARGATARTAQWAPSASLAPHGLSHAPREASAALRGPPRVLFAKPELTSASRVRQPARYVGQATSARWAVSSKSRYRAKPAATSTLAV